MPKLEENPFRDTENGAASRDESPEELEIEGKKKETVEKSWEDLVPNVEDYRGWAARAIAAGSGQVVKGILWCGDVIVDRLKWGDEFLKRRMKKVENSEISPEALWRLKMFYILVLWIKKFSEISEQAATGILAFVAKVSGFFTSSIANFSMKHMVFRLLPGEIVLAYFDGFNKVCDAVEVAGTNVMSTTAIVTTGLVFQRHGEAAAQVTRELLDAAGHVIATVWVVFKLTKVPNTRSFLKPSSLAPNAAAWADLKEKQT